MAFLVCYSWSPSDDHAKNKAIYLDQKFYDLIWFIRQVRTLFRGGRIFLA